MTALPAAAPVGWGVSFTLGGLDAILPCCGAPVVPSSCAAGAGPAPSCSQCGSASLFLWLLPPLSPRCLAPQGWRGGLSVGRSRSGINRTLGETWLKLGEQPGA